MTSSVALALLLFFAAPFWETKTPRDWTDAELAQMFEDSPWSQIAGNARGDSVVVYLATAEPMREAEREYRRRHAPKSTDGENPDALYREYTQFLAENEGKAIVLAMRADRKAFADSKEVQTMEEECELRVKGKKLQLVGHFPPTDTDPYLRLVFPRMLGPADTKLQFELYIPGIENHYVEASFKLSDLKFRGNVEY